jgi:hypothetical protein
MSFLGVAAANCRSWALCSIRSFVRTPIMRACPYPSRYHYKRSALPIFTDYPAGMVKARVRKPVQARNALKIVPIKTDRNDARGIAELVRLGWFRPVHCKTIEASRPAGTLSALVGSGKAYSIVLSH